MRSGISFLEYLELCLLKNMFQECFGCFCFRKVSGVNDERFQWYAGITWLDQIEQRSKPLWHSMKSWLVNRDSCHGLLQSLYYWVRCHPLYPGFWSALNCQATLFQANRGDTNGIQNHGTLALKESFFKYFLWCLLGSLDFFTRILWDIFIYKLYNPLTKPFDSTSKFQWDIPVATLQICFPLS